MNVSNRMRSGALPASIRCANRATNVPVTVKYESADGPQTKTLTVDQRKPTKNGFADLLELKLKGDSKVIVILGTKDTNGHVIADAVQLE